MRCDSPREGEIGEVSEAYDHPSIDVWPGSAPDDPAAAAAAPYGPVVQRGRCAACGATVERSLRLSGWGPWRSQEPGEGSPTHSS